MSIDLISSCFLRSLSLVLLLSYSCDQEPKIRTEKNLKISISEQSVKLKVEDLGECTMEKISHTPPKENIPLTNSMDYIWAEKFVEVDVKKNVPPTDSSCVGRKLTVKKIRSTKPEVRRVSNIIDEEMNNFNFSGLNLDESLNANSVRDMVNDRNGNIWIATEGGLIKFDGVYTSFYKRQQGLPDTYVVNLAIGEDGCLWIATFSGLCKFDGRYFYHYMQEELKLDCFFLDVFVSKNNQVWASAYEKGMFRIENDSIWHYDQKNLGLESVLSICENAKGEVLAGTNGSGLCVLRNNQFQPYLASEIGNKSVLSLHMTDNKSLYIGLSTGLRKYKDNKIYTLQTNNTEFNQVIRDVVNDEKQNVWLATDSGLYILKNGKVDRFTDQTGLRKNKIWSILKDRFQTMWLGSRQGGLQCYKGTIFSVNPKVALDKDAVIYTVQGEKNGKVWIGTDHGMVELESNCSRMYTQENGLISNTVYSLLQDKQKTLWIGTNLGLSILKKNNDLYNFEHPSLKYAVIRDIFEDPISNTIWIATHRGLFSISNNRLFHYNLDRYSTGIACIHQNEKGHIIVGFRNGLFELENTSGKKMTFKVVNINKSVTSFQLDYKKRLWIGTDEGVFLRKNKNYYLITEKNGLVNNNVKTLYRSEDSSMFIGTGNGFSVVLPMRQDQLFDSLEKGVEMPKYNACFDNNTYKNGFIGQGFFRNKTIWSDGNLFYLGGYNLLTMYQYKAKNTINLPSKLRIFGVKIFNEELEWFNLENNQDTVVELFNGRKIKNLKFDSLTDWYNTPVNLVLPSYNNSISFRYLGVQPDQHGGLFYKYRLVGFDNKWTALSDNIEVDYSSLPSGKYRFEVQCVNNYGVWSNVEKFSFSIETIVWTRGWMIFLYFIIIVFIIYFLTKLNAKRLRAKTKYLKDKISEATFTILHQKKLVELRNKDILDSLNYASRIQQSFLPSNEQISQIFPNSFLLNYPKDIVSGDFYFMEENKDEIFFGVGDCTGHGVPGALMSIVSFDRLQRAILKKNEVNLILPLVNKWVKSALNHSNKKNATMDGMDIALCKIHKNYNKSDTFVLDFAGANRPLWLFSKKEGLKVLNSNKVSIAGSTPTDHEFTKQTIEITKGDSIYLFSDGIVDCFGGEKGKKLMTKGFREVLTKIQGLTMKEQGQYIHQFLMDWKKDVEQCDDMLIFGIKF